MNDCVFCFMKICECKEYRCKKYISINTEKGREISDKLDKEIIEVSMPIIEKFKKEYEIE